MSRGARKAIGWAVLCLAAIGLVLGRGWVAYPFQKIVNDEWPALSPEKTAQPVVSYSKSPTDSKFAISLLPPVDHPEKGTKLHITLVLTNWGGEPVQLLEIKDTGCPALKVVGPSTPSRVDKNRSSLYPLELEATCPEEAQPISLLYRAQAFTQADSKGNIPSASVTHELDGQITTAPLPLATEDRRKWARGFRLAGAMLRLFVVPITLLFFGWWLSRLVALRDERLKEEQEARDRHSEVLNTLISGYRELVVGDYLPLVRLMQSVEIEMPAALKAPAEGSLKKEEELKGSRIEGVLCAILLFRARLLSFVKQKGGIYFCSKQAELLMADLIAHFLNKIWEQSNKEDFERLVQMLAPDDTLAVAKQKYKDLMTFTKASRNGVALVASRLGGESRNQVRDAYQRVEESLLEWMNDKPTEFRAYTRLLQLAMQLLQFECDRPFYQTGGLDNAGRSNSKLASSGWYLDPPVIEFTKEMYLIPEELKWDKVDSAGTGETCQEGLYTRLTRYLDSLPRECRVKCGKKNRKRKRKNGEVPFPPMRGPGRDDARTQERVAMPLLGKSLSSGRTDNLPAETEGDGTSQKESPQTKAGDPIGRLLLRIFGGSTESE